MSSEPLGGIIHTYQGYDPKNFPSPTQPPPDFVSPAFEHMLRFGETRELTDAELARAVHLDIKQIAGLGPSLESLRKMLEERKRKILEKWETTKVQADADKAFQKQARTTQPPDELKDAYKQAIESEQIRDLELLWYRTNERSRFARQLLQLVERLGDKYQVDELASKYEFTGRQPMSIDEALAIKAELETIDKLLKQLEEAAETAQIAIIDLEEMAQFADGEQMDELAQLQRQVEQMLQKMAEQQGLEKTKRGYQLTPQAYRLFQGKLLERIFSQLQASRSGRHQGPIVGEGAVELQTTKPYEFGDSITQMDMPQSLINALLRTTAERITAPGTPLRLTGEDIVIHRTKNNPKCATAVLMDMSGSMRQGGQYVNVKRMALALDGLIRKEYPATSCSSWRCTVSPNPSPPEMSPDCCRSR
jgi:uncharacterized protein with von Willebrand factor type A (vWA) domain